MAQYDLLLTQNVHATLTEYSEKFVNVAKGGLISAITDQTPTVLAGGTDGYVLVRDDVEVTGLKWADLSTLGVSVANQANDRIITATATADDLNAEAQLTYNTSQGLLIGSGLGIVFTAAATTYQIYTPASAFTAGISIITGTNSAAGAGDITLKAGDGVAAGGNVYFQRDTTYGNFYFGTGAATHVPEAATGTHGVMLVSSVGLVSESADLHWDVATVTLSLDDPSARLNIGSSDDVYIYNGAVAWQFTGHYFRLVQVGDVMRFDYSTTSNYSSFSSPIYIDGTNGYVRLQWDTVLDAGEIFYLDGVSGDSRIWDATGDLTFRDASNTGGVTLSDIAGAVSGVSPWQVNTNLITTATAGDDVRLVSGERLYFGDSGSTYIEGTAGESTALNIYDGAVLVFTTEATYIRATSFRPLADWTTTPYDLGSTAYTWRSIYVNAIYFNSNTDYIIHTSGYIDMYNASNLVFRFAPLTGTHITYNDILAGGTGLDLGDTGGNPFNSVAADRYYVAVIGTYIDVSGTDMTFTSVAAGTVNLADIGTGDGTVTAVNNGNGMNFTNITTSGTVTLGTGGSVTASSTNAVTTSSHTHALDQSGIGSEASTVSTIARRNVSGDIFVRLLRSEYTSTSATCNYFLTQIATGVGADNYARPSTDTQVVAFLDGHIWAFTANNTHTGAERYTGAGSLEFEDDVELFFGTASDWQLSFDTSTSPDHLILNDRGLTAGTNFLIRDNGATRFTFDMAGGTGTATDWIATSDVRAKTNINPFELDMDKFLYLGSKAIRHNWREGWGPANLSSIGFIAQDIEKFFPELVTIRTEKPYLRGISYGKMVTVAIKATAQTWEYAVAIDGKLDVVRSEVEDLKLEVEDLKKQLNTIQNG